MRTNRLILTIVVLLACSIFLIGMQKGVLKPPLPVENVKNIEGSWANPDYNLIENKYAKIKLRYNNTWSTYSTNYSSELLKRGKYIIVEGWRGDEYKKLGYPLYSSWMHMRHYYVFL